MSIVSSGQVLVNTQVIPYIRRTDIEFAASDMLPYKAANFYFDETDVSNYCQRPSELTLTAAPIVLFTKQQPFINQTTGAYFTLLDFNSSNTMYMNENFLTLNVVNALSDSYQRDDIVVQYLNNDETTNNAVFVGRVAHWEYKAGQESWLVLEVTEESVFSANVDSSANTIWNKRTNNTANIASILGNTAIDRFESGQIIKSLGGDAQLYSVSSYKNHSGQILGGSNNTINLVELPSNLPNLTTGTLYTLRVVAGTGAGTLRTNVPIADDNQLDLSGNPLSEALDGTSRYTLNPHIVDEFGKISGIFNLPESDAQKFRTGERVFTVTDANDYLDGDAQMRATAIYVASGSLNTVQEVRVPEVQDSTTPGVVPQPPTHPPPPIIICVNMRRRWRRRRRRDPVAQTFFVPEPASSDSNYGVFATSVDLFFKSKPLEAAGDLMLPVTVRLVAVVNGYPTQDLLASATVYPDKVNVTDGVSAVPSVDNDNTKTRFTFDNPVYLQPAGEYAIVVFSESPEYEVWISELGESVIGTDRRVSEQPNAGSFFRSQNASTWTPYQNQDLMFIINQAIFSSGGQATYTIKPPLVDTYADELLLHTTDVAFPATNLRYEFKATKDSTRTLDSYFTSITPNEYLKFGADLQNSSVLNDRRKVIEAGNSSSFQLQVTLLSSSNTVTPIFNHERIGLIAVENSINSGGIAAEDITITDGGGQHYDSNVANISVTLSGGYQVPGATQAELSVTTDDIDATGNIVSLTVVNGGSGYLEMPVVTITDTTPGVTANATAVIIGEDSSFGGNAKARYVTRKITLADGFDAGDLRVFLRASRPQGTDLAVYYKVLSSSDPEYFYNKKWKRMELTKNLYSIGQQDLIELEYRPNLISGRLSYVEDGIEYPLGGTFKHFAIKIVMLSKDTTVVPYVKNFRAIASPEG